MWGESVGFSFWCLVRFQSSNYLFTDISLLEKTKQLWGLFLLDTYIVLNCLLGHCQLLCLFSWVPAAACGALPVWFWGILGISNLICSKKIALPFLFLSEHFFSFAAKKNPLMDKRAVEIIYRCNLFLSLVFIYTEGENRVWNSYTWQTRLFIVSESPFKTSLP